MNSKRKTRANATRGVRTTKGTPDKNVPVEGVYGNARFMHSTASLVGCVVQLQVKNGGLYEGIFRTFSNKFDVVLEMVHKIEDNLESHPVPAKENLLEKFIFHAVDVVSIVVKNVDLSYPTKDSFATDAAISKFNGQINTERELEPWEGEECEELISLEAENANGWDPDDMFRTNAEQYGVTSSYDSTLAGYTTPLNPKNTKEYQKREAEAQKIAQEIESSALHKTRSELENGDEEDRFSAVIRPNENSNVGKYVPPPKRKGVQGGKLIRSTPSPQSSNSAISPINRCHTISSPPTTSDSTLDSKINGEKSCKDDRKFDDTDSRTSGDLSSRENSNNSLSIEKDASSLINKIDRKNSNPKAREEEIAELKEFSSNFKLTEDNEKENKIDETPKIEQNDKSEKTDTDTEKTTNSLKKFTLNPNAKEFVLNPNAKAFTPRNTSPQTPTPPRLQTQSPVMPPPQATPAIMPSQIFTTIAPQYVMSPNQMNVSMTHPFNMATMQQPPRGYRKTKVHYKTLSICLEAVPMSVQPRPPELVAAATGQPLLAPGSIPQHQFVQFPPQSVVTAPGVQHPITYPQIYPIATARMVTPQGMTMVPASHTPGTFPDTQHPTQVYGEILHYTVSPPPGAGMPTHMTPTGHHPTMHVSGHPQSTAGQQNQINMSQQAMHSGPNQSHSSHNTPHPSAGSQPAIMYSAHSQMGQPGLHPNPHTPTSPQSLHSTPVTHSHTTPHMQPTPHASNPHTHVTQAQTHPIPTPHGPHQSLVLVPQQAPTHLSGHQVPGHQLQGHPIQGPHHVPGQPHPVLPHSSVSAMPVTSAGNVAPTHYIPHPQVGHSHPQPPVQTFHHPQ